MSVKADLSPRRDSLQAVFKQRRALWLRLTNIRARPVNPMLRLAASTNLAEQSRHSSNPGDALRHSRGASDDNRQPAWNGPNRRSVPDRIVERRVQRSTTTFYRTDRQ
jgi:hypothetical protein